MLSCMIAAVSPARRAAIAAIRVACLWSALGSAAGVARAAPLATRAAPLATVSEDLDGDGAPDTIELGGDGVVRIAGTPRGEVKLAPAITRGQLAVARYRGQPYVVAQIATPGAPGTDGAVEAVILHAEGGRWREILRTPVGGVGLDHDYGVAIDATADGIYRYQTRGDIRRCDGKPAYLFAEKFDGARFRRASAVPSNVADTAPVLTATRDLVPARPPLLYQAHAASLEVGVGDAGGLVIPRELDDGRLDTLWREELAGSTGEGQFFTFEPRAATARAVQLRIVPGDPASSATMRSFNRPRRIAVVAGAGATAGAAAGAAIEAWRIELPDAAGAPLGSAFIIDLPRPVAGCVTVILETTYGAPRGTTAIAELEVFAEGERQGGGEAVLAHAVAEGAAGALTAAAALGTRGNAGAVAIDRELATTTDPGARRRLIGALAKIGEIAAVPALVHAASAGWVRGQDLLDVIGALGALGQVQALHDLAAKDALPIAARVAAVAPLGGTGSGFARLVELAGSGPRELRRAVTERLAAAPLDTLLGAVATQARAAAAGDLWHAITRGTRASPGHRQPALAAMTAALPAALDYERRYRLVDGIAALGDAPALSRLAAWLAALAPGAEASALRQVAVAAIAANPRGAAMGFVVDHARDRDPGVRLAALSALAVAELDGPPRPADGAAASPGPSLGPNPGASPGAIDGVIGDALAHDAWPEVRRRAATALGVRCQRPAPAHALGDAVDHDADLGVRGDALAALVQCHAAGTAALLARIWHDGQAPLELRSRAVLEVVALGDPAPAAALVGQLARWRNEASSSAEALTLAQSAAATLGRLGRLSPPGAARALTDALDDTAYPEIVQAAALGLGALGPACPAEAKAKLAQIAQSEDNQAAGAARRAAAQCGH
jgi:hypothetical protein